MRSNSQRGLTLLETVIFLGIFILIISAIVASLRYVYRGQRFAFEQADATRSARSGLEQAVRDLREASYADDGAYPIVAMTYMSLTFYSDYDNDGKIERIRYFLDGTDLKKGLIESAGDPPTYDPDDEVVTIVAQNVRNASLWKRLFSFYDRDGNEITDLTDIDALAFVVVAVVVDLHPERAPDYFELRSSASLRNI